MANSSTSNLNNDGSPHLLVAGTTGGAAAAAAEGSLVKNNLLPLVVSVLVCGGLCCCIFGIFPSKDVLLPKFCNYNFLENSLPTIMVGLVTILFLFLLPANGMMKIRSFILLFLVFVLGYHHYYYWVIGTLIILVLTWTWKEQEEDQEEHEGLEGDQEGQEEQEGPFHFYTKMILKTTDTTSMVMTKTKSILSRLVSYFPKHPSRSNSRNMALENKDIMMNIFAFVGPGHYIYVAGVSTKFKEYYLEYCNNNNNHNTNHNKKETFYSVAFSSLACAKFWYNVTGRGNLGNTNRQEDGTVSVRVAMYGTLQVMEWVHQIGFPWFNCTSMAAAQFGRLEMLRYLHENGVPWHERTAHKAAYFGHLSCLRYAHENGCDWNEATCMAAAAGGSLNCLQYAHENGCRWDEQTTFQAIAYGGIECLQYALQNNCPWISGDISACSWASSKGKLNCLRLAHQYGCPLNQETCIFAAWFGHLDCLQYAHQNGCPWRAQTCWFALKHGNLHCFNYAIQNGCPCPDRFYVRASDAGANIISVPVQGRRYLVLQEQEEEIQQLVQHPDGLSAIHKALLVPPSRESTDSISQALRDVRL